MCYSYDVIKRLSKSITHDSGVFIPVSIDAKGIKIDQETRELLFEKGKRLSRALVYRPAWYTNHFRKGSGMDHTV